MTPAKIRDGDIFRWLYARGCPPNPTSYNRYWCKSRIAIAGAGILRDTYWGAPDISNSTCWSYEQAVTELTIQFVANFSDLENTNEGNAEYYDDADCVNLNHPNSSRGNFYIRKGAIRSSAKMLEIAKYKRDRAISEMLQNASEIRRLDETIAQIMGGVDLARLDL